MLEFFSLLSLILCFAITLSRPSNKGKKFFVFVNISSFGIFLIAASNFNITQTYTNLHIIVTGVANVIPYLIFTSYYYYVEDCLTWLCADDSISKYDHEKKMIAFKIIVVVLIVTIILLSSFLGYYCYKVYKSNLEINTYKSDIESYKNQIDEFKSDDRVQNAAIDVLKTLRSNLKREIKMYEKVTGNTKGFVFITKTGNKFHLEDCHYLKNSSYFIMYSVAVKRRYTPCSNCLPNGY